MFISPVAARAVAPECPPVPAPGVRLPRVLRYLTPGLFALMLALAWASPGRADPSPVAVPAPQGIPVSQGVPMPYPRVLFYFPFLPVPGVPSQVLPAPPNPYVWPFPVLVVLPPQPSQQPFISPGQAMSPASPPLLAPARTPEQQPRVAGAPPPPAGQADSPVPPPPAVPTADAPAPTPGAAVPTAATATDTPAQVVRAAPPDTDKNPVDAMHASPPVITASPASDASKGAGKDKADVRKSATKAPKGTAAPATRKPKASKARKLCWKDGRLDVCK